MSGIRDSGFGIRVLLLIILLAACRARETRVSVPANAPVILISIDTLRADHLPAYGYGAVDTPNINALRKDAILFRNAYSHVPLTLPSHVSILTGELPPDNGVRNNIGFPFDASKHATIPSLLKQRGYATGAAVSAYVLRANTGLGSAFDFYDDRIDVREAEAVGRLQRPGMETEAVAEQWIGPRARQPFFFLLHLFEPHTPYDPPEPFRSRYANRYDGEIAAADAIVGKFIDFLKRSGVYDQSMLILLSDHGEGLGEHGEDEHGIFLYREDLHVPLMVKLPKSDRANSTVDAPVALIDILPTIVGGAKTKGRSLLENGPVRRIYSETLYPRIHLGWSDLRSLVDDQFHYIDAPRPELYAIPDAAERNNVAADNRRVYASMRKDLEPFNREMPAIGNIDPEEAKKLTALGYLGSAAAGTSGPLPDPKDNIAELNLLKDAASLETGGHLAEAIAKYREVIDRNPRLTDAWSQLARLLQESGNTKQAIETYKRAIAVAPSLAGEFSLALGDLYLSVNQPDQAAAHAQLGLATNPGSAHVILGRAALAKGDLTTATAQAEEAMKSYSYRAPASILEAQILVRQKRLDEASAALDQALADARARNDRVPPLLNFVRGDILARRNRIDEAVAAFNEEIRVYPHDRQAYANLTAVYLLTGRRREANETMERLVRANPDPSSYEMAAETFAQLHDDVDAAAWRRRGHALR
ncbi:MAG TPA: sulfatase-like hydrolase/transferase [Thermoanaerobaculia bacterium]|nr:sulfatase-like hydrolase/transferase [Thermoanaerobaculia bacterium]